MNGRDRPESERIMSWQKEAISKQIAQLGNARAAVCELIDLAPRSSEIEKHLMETKRHIEQAIAHLGDAYNRA
jgi:hypothetical protein